MKVFKSVSWHGNRGATSRRSATTSGSDCCLPRRVVSDVTGSTTRPTFDGSPSVRRARGLGFTLDQVRALLALSTKDGRDACCEVHDLAAAHLGEVRTKIADLRAMERILADAVRRCAAGELPGCPIIDALSGDRLET